MTELEQMIDRIGYGKAIQWKALKNNGLVIDCIKHPTETVNRLNQEELVKAVKECRDVLDYIEDEEIKLLIKLLAI